jgi:hypothetical protein
MSKGNGQSRGAPHDLLNVETLEGDGDVEMVIFQRGDQVVMRFREPMLWVGFDPTNAVAVGKQLIDLAVACGANVEIVVPRQEVSREQRAVLTQRTAHIVRSMSAGGRPIDFIAQQVVDSILAEIG